MRGLPRGGSTGFRAGAAIQVAAKYASALVHLAITMVLARLLTPEQFGVVAIVTVVLGLFSVISNVGINAAVIQYRDLERGECSALLSFTFLLGIVLAGVFCGLSVPVAALYGNGEYVALMCLASPAVLFNSANMVPDGLLVREKRFLAIGVRTLAVAIGSGAVCVTMAFNGFGVYALVANSLISSAAVFAWNLAASGLRLGNWDFRGPLREVGRFSGYQFAAQLLQYLIRNLDNLLVGYALGATQLGFYDKAYRLAKYPVDYIPAAVNPVLKSYFSSLQDDLSALYASFVRVQKLLTVTGAFASVFCVFAAEELVLLMFGGQWGDSVPPFRILAASIVFQVANFTVFSALEGLKRTDLLLRHTAVNGVVTIGLLLAALTTGDLNVVAAGVCAGFVLSAVPYVHYVVRRGFGQPVLPYLRLFVPEAVATAATAAVYLLLQPLMPGDIVLSLVLKLVAGLSVYGGLMALMGQAKYLDVLVGRRRKPCPSGKEKVK